VGRSGLFSGQLKIAHASSDSTAVNHAACYPARPIAISRDGQVGDNPLSKINTSPVQSPSVSCPLVGN
jgi:hypothetical protein